MKAIYQKPETNVTFVAVQQLMVSSPLGNPEDGFNLDDAPETGESSGNLSRGRSIWDDED